MKRLHVIIAASLVLVLAFGGGAYYYKASQAQDIARLAQPGESPFNRPASASLGAESAKVVIVEFFDPACEACRMMYPYVKSLLRTHEGKLRLSLRYATFHQGSDYVARVLEAARLQGEEMYWRSVESVLANQPVWADHERPAPQKVWDFLEKTGLDLEKARKDMDDPRIAALLRQDAMDLETLKVAKTPSFFINGRPLETFGQNSLRFQVESEIKRAYP